MKEENKNKYNGPKFKYQVKTLEYKVDETYQQKKNQDGKKVSKIIINLTYEVIF